MINLSTMWQEIMNNTFTKAFYREGFNQDELMVPCPECRGRGDKSCFLCKGLGLIAKEALEADTEPEPMRPDRGINYQHGYTGQDSSWTGF